MGLARDQRVSAFVAVDPEGLVVEASPPALELFGVDAIEALEKRPVGELFCRRDRDSIRTALEGPQPLVFLSSILHAKTKREIEVCVSLGGPLGQHRRALLLRPLETTCPLRESITRLEDEQRRLFESLHVGVVIHGPGSELLYWNQKALELLGMSEGQLTGRTSFDPRWNVIHQDGSDFPGAEHPVNVAIRSKQPVVGVVMGVHRPEPGDRVWLVVDAQPRMSREGELEDVVVTFTDITQQKRLAEEVAQAQKYELVNNLSGGIAHDFNNMLAVIMSVAELGQLDARDPEQREAFADILEAAKRGSQLSRRLLSLSGRSIEQRRRIAIDAALREISTLARRALGESFELELELGAEATVCCLDPSRFEQAVLNLIINARDAMPEGGTITLRTAGDGEQVAIEVRDTGAGIPDHAIAHVFEPFFTTKGKDEGTGLGLATVKDFVTAANGEVSFETSGEGTCFRITLPCEIVSANEAESSAPAGRAKLGTPSPPRRLLVVDNDPQLRRAMAETLRRLGHEVMVAPTAEVALAVLDENSIHLLVTDLAMDRMDGGSLALHAREDRPDLPVLFVSGFVGQHGESMPPASPTSRFLSKPFSMAELREVIEALLASAEIPRVPGPA